MIKIIYKKVNCENCKEKTECYNLSFLKKKINLCGNCLNKLYTNAGKFIVPKSPRSILKKDNRILVERFN